MTNSLAWLQLFLALDSGFKKKKKNWNEGVMFLARLKEAAPQGSPVASGGLKNVHFVFL